MIPTFQRREVVVRAVEALAAQRDAPPFEVVVVVDGSTDGSADALRALRVPFPLTVLEQANAGASVARNAGAAAASGEILLFLDDDMEPAEALLRAHDEHHRAGADVVLGHIPLHPDSRRDILSAGVGQWAQERLAQLTAPGAELTLHDLLTGQLSIGAELFARVGGFDTDFTGGGSFGGEDIDFGYRLLKAGHRIAFAPEAVSHQRYVVTPTAHLRQWRQAGRADVVFAIKHPEQRAQIVALGPVGRRSPRWRTLLRVPVAGRAVAGALGQIATAGLAVRPLSGRMGRVFFLARDVQYLVGVEEQGGFAEPAAVRVLAYHAVDDLPRGSALHEYAVPPDHLRRQLAGLRRRYTFVSLEQALIGDVPRRAVLVTFDDCYRDLVLGGLPVLRELDMPAVAFAVSDRVGDWNRWDEHLGAPRLDLADAAGLRALAAAGIEIGAHSRTHPELPKLTDEELAEEVRGSIDALAALGLERPRAFAYPYGEFDRRVIRAVGDAGVQVAFTVRPGVLRASTDRYAVPRVEIVRSDGTGWRFRFKVALAGRPLWLHRRLAALRRRR